jgi:hypothetical protein
MVFNAVEILAGSEGFKKIHGTGAVAGVEYNALVVRQDTTFSAFTVVDANGFAINKFSTADMSGVTFQIGEFLPAGKGAKITAFTISTGSVLAY